MHTVALALTLDENWEAIQAWAMWRRGWDIAALMYLLRLFASESVHHGTEEQHTILRLSEQDLNTAFHLN